MGDTFVGAVIAGVGAFVASGFNPFVAIGVFALNLGVGLLSAALQDRPDNESVFENDVSTQANTRVIYGETKTGAQIVDMRDHPDNEKELYMPVALCVASEDGTGIDSVQKVWMDEELALDGPVAGNTFNDRSAIRPEFIDAEYKIDYALKLGTDTQTTDLTGLHDVWPLAWPETSKGRGIAWMNFVFRQRLKPEDRGFWRGIPNITCLIRGNKCYDPRDGTWKWTRNPALILLDYLTSKRYGAGFNYPERDGNNIDGTPEVNGAHSTGATSVSITAGSGEQVTLSPGAQIGFEGHDYTYEVTSEHDYSGSTESVSITPALQDSVADTSVVFVMHESEIDIDSFITEANYCDEQIVIPIEDGIDIVQDRFTCDMWLSTGSDIMQNITAILSSMRGNLVYQNGQLRLYIRKPTSPVALTLNEDNIIGEWNIGRAGSKDVHNRITAKFPDADRRYTTNEVYWPNTDDAIYQTYLDEDGGTDTERMEEVQLPGTTNIYRARRIATTMLKEERADMSMALTANEQALQLQVGDVVPVTHEVPGFTDRLFWVMALGIQPDFTVRLVLREYADVFADEAQPGDDLPEEPDLPPTPCPPDDLPDTDDMLAWYGEIGHIDCSEQTTLTILAAHARGAGDYSGNGNFGGITKGDGTPDYSTTQDVRCHAARLSDNFLDEVYTIKTGATTQNLISSNMIVAPHNSRTLSSDFQFTNDGRAFTLSGSFKIRYQPLTNPQTLFGQRDDANDEGFSINVRPFEGKNHIDISYYDADDPGSLKTASRELPDTIDPGWTENTISGDPCPDGSIALSGPYVDFDFVFLSFTTEFDLDGIVIVYMNGVNQGVINIGRIVTPTSGARMAVAGLRGDSATFHNFHGYIDEVIFWNKALSKCEIENYRDNFCGWVEDMLPDSGEQPFLRASPDTSSPIDIRVTPNVADYPQVQDPAYAIFLQFYEDGQFVTDFTHTDLLVEAGTTTESGGTVINTFNRSYTLTADEGGETIDTHRWVVEAQLVDRNTNMAIASGSTSFNYTYSAGSTVATASVTAGSG